MLQVQNLTFERGEHRLFSDVNLVVYPGQKVAIVGRNGVGKSTFFNLLMGRLEASQGDITYPQDWLLGYMAQEVLLLRSAAGVQSVPTGAGLGGTAAPSGPTGTDPEPRADSAPRSDQAGGGAADAQGTGRRSSSTAGPTPCRNGATCTFKAAGRCLYHHDADEDPPLGREVASRSAGPAHYPAG